MKDRFKNHVELAPAEWRLREQVEELQEWLENHRHELDPNSRWIADIGFSVRPDTIAGGPPIYRRMMEMCLEVNMEIYLSEYQGQAQALKSQMSKAKNESSSVGDVGIQQIPFSQMIFISGKWVFAATPSVILVYVGIAFITQLFA